MNMKTLKLSLPVWLFAVLFALTANAYAQQDSKRAEEVAKITEEAQKTLNGFTWNLDVTSTAAKKEDRVTTKDTVIFKDNKLNSSGLGEKGFGTSNYTLTVGDDNVPVFETMQRNDAEDTVFWRGEVVDGQIRGVISVQEKDKPAVSFGFQGQKAGEAAEIPAEKIEPQPEPVPETVEAPAEPVADEAVAETAVTDGVEAVTEEATAIVEEVAAPAVVEEPVAEEKPVVEEPKPAKQPWWAPKKK